MNMAENVKIQSSRNMLPKEFARWNYLRNLIFRAKDRWQAARHRMNVVIEISKFCTQNGIELQTLSNISNVEKDLLSLETEIRSGLAIFFDCENGYLGINFHDNDFDVIQPATDISPTVQGLGFPPIVAAAIGVISVVALISRWAYIEHKAVDLDVKLKNTIRESDKLLCSDSNSEICSKWKERKETAGIKREASIAETITSGLDKAGHGLSIGIAIALPVLAYAMFRKGS